MTGRLSKGLRAATFLSIAIVVLAGGCDHPARRQKMRPQLPMRYCTH